MQDSKCTRNEPEPQNKLSTTGPDVLFPGGSDLMRLDPSQRQPSAFDFEVPDWLFPPVPCPNFPKEPLPPSPKQQELFLTVRAFNVDEWLAAKGYKKTAKAGHLGLIFDAGSGLVSREGNPFHAYLNGKLAGLFRVMLHAGPSGLKDFMVAKVYPGTAAARRTAKKELRQKLGPLGVTIPNGRWALTDKRDNLREKRLA